MAAPDRRAGRPLEQQLFEEGHRFEFYRAVALLEHMNPGAFPVGESAEPSREAVRFESSLSFDFPASEIHTIEPAHDGEPARMRVTFMGLGGALGPLPNAVSEVATERAWRKDGGFKAFLDVFNHRLVSLMYRVRRKGRIGVGIEAPPDSPYARYLFSFIGLGTPRLRGRMGINDRSLLAYVGLLAGRARSLPGLETMLTEYFGVTIKVRPFTGRWLALDETQRTVIGRSGRNNDLNGGAVIGSRVWDEQGHFTLEVGPLGFSRFADFLPAGRSYHRAVALTKFYVGQEFDFDVKLVLAAPHVPRARIARTTGAYLGWTSWLRSGGSAGKPGVVVLQSDYRPVGAG